MYMNNTLEVIRNALERSNGVDERPGGASVRDGSRGTRDARDGWISPEYHDSQKAEIDFQTAEAHRCLCLLSDNDALEYYKVLRAQIQQRAVANSWNTIMVTSPHPGEGKTLTTINLALTMSREFSQTVLLVDADLKYQDVHKYLGYAHPFGLADYLDGDMPLSEVIVWPGVEKLTIISGGKTVHGSTEMLTSPRMKSLMREMKTRYEGRYVLFDVPPVLNSSDAISFAHLVDAILLIVEEGRTTMADVQRAISLLPEEKMLGIAMNRHRFDARGRREGYGFVSKIKRMLPFG